MFGGMQSFKETVSPKFTFKVIGISELILTVPA